MSDSSEKNTENPTKLNPDKSGQRPSLKNRKIFVNSKIQSVFIGYAVAMGFLFLSLGLTLSSSFERILMIQMNGGESLTIYDFTLFLVFLFLIIFVIFLGMLISIRVVGPIFKLVGQMENLQATGELQELKFRKNDYFQEVAVSYNKIVARIRELESKIPKT